MVFSSIPVYGDPHNWQQLPVGGNENNQQSPYVLPPPSSGGGNTDASTGSIRPGSMVDRARLAKLPQPEVALKCPRCESTNTKFCYFNNYNFSQPRHFCKTCRRYWTRGGALRNVPVGGGCRRNKRSKKSTRSKSPQGGGSSSTTDMIIGHLLHPPPPQLSLLPSLPHPSDYGNAEIGLNFDRSQPPVATVGGGTGTDTADQQYWRLQQFPFLANLEPQPPSGMYPFEGELATMKMEENQNLNFPIKFFGIQGNDQYMGGNINAWTDLSGFTSSSTSHLL